MSHIIQDGRMAPLKVLKSDSLVLRAVESLKSFILEEMLVPGALMPSQAELGSRLNVSRTVVREAMRILESQGFLRISQGKLPEVMPPSTQGGIDSLSTLMERSKVTLLDVLAVRRPLEIEAAVLASQHATETQIAAMEHANTALEEARSMDAQILADARFHTILAEASGNPIFSIMLDVLGQFLIASRRQTLRQSGASVAVHHHRCLIEALRARDPERAKAAAEGGMAQTASDLKQSVSLAGVRSKASRSAKR